MASPRAIGMFGVGKNALISPRNHHGKSKSFNKTHRTPRANDSQQLVVVFKTQNKKKEIKQDSGTPRNIRNALKFTFENRAKEDKSLAALK